LQRSAGGIAMVLEEDDVAEAVVLLEIVDALLEGPEGLFDELFGHVAGGLVVVGPLHDDLVGADAVHLVVHALALAVQRAFDAEDGELIGHDAHPPAWLIAIPRSAVGQHFGRRLVFVPVAERAHGGSGRRRRLPDKIAGTFGAIRGDDDPSPRDGVLTEFRQVRRFLQSDEQRSATLDYIVAEMECFGVRVRTFCTAEWYNLYERYNTMTRLNVSKAREEFPDVVNRAAYAKERTIVSRRGKDLAAV